MMRHTPLFALFLLLSGVVGRPARRPLWPIPQHAARPKEETFGDLMKMLKAQQARDRYTDDPGKLLSRILEKAAGWNETGSFQGEFGGTDAYDAEHRSLHLMAARDVLRFDTHSIRTLRSGRYGDSLKSNVSARYIVNAKRIDTVSVRRYYGPDSNQFSATGRDEVYEIYLGGQKNAKAVDVKEDITTIDPPRKNTGAFDDRDRDWTDRVNFLRLHVACGREEAVAIGRAIKKLLQLRGGTVSFVDYTEKGPV